MTICKDLALLFSAVCAKMIVTMAISFNTKKLKTLLAAFNRRLNVTVTLFSADLKYFCDAGSYQPYCLAIGEDEERLKKCKECDLYYARKAHDLRDTVVYTCHAGIAEVVAPVFCDGVLVAYLMPGKFRDAEHKFSSESTVAEAADKYGLDKEKMLEAYYKLPVFDKTYIDDIVMLLQACVSYIGTEEILRINRPIIAKQIAEYIDAHLNDKITTESLCAEFHVARHILYDIFEKNFNATVQRYIADKRLELAKSLLVSTDKSMRQIADETGSSQYNFFIHYFKKQTGITPLQYRKRFSKL